MATDQPPQAEHSVIGPLQPVKAGADPDEPVGQRQGSRARASDHVIFGVVRQRTTMCFLK